MSMRPESMSAQAADFPQAEACRVQHGQQHAVAQRVDAAEEGHELVDREHDGQMALAAAIRNAEHEIGAVEDVEVSVYR